MTQKSKRTMTADARVVYDKELYYREATNDEERCLTPGCTRVRGLRGYCKNHASQVRRHDANKLKGTKGFKMSTVACLYHRADFDGKCAGAVVASRFPDATFIGVDYGDDLSALVNQLNNLDRLESVYIVDFTLDDVSLMIALSRQYDLYWFDHHTSAVNKMADIADFKPKVKHVNVDNTKSGCELVWRYFHNLGMVPHAVELCGKYDRFDFSIPGVEGFDYGLRLFGEMHPTDKKWVDLLAGIDVNAVIDTGKIILHQREIEDDRIAAATCFTVSIDGINILASNRPLTTTKTIRSRIEKKHNALMVFYRLCDGRWKFTVSQIPGLTEFNAGEFAKRFGGGGREEVAGFILDHIPEWAK